MVMIGARLIFFTACERVVVGGREVLEARDACERVVVGALDTVLSGVAAADTQWGIKFCSFPDCLPGQRDYISIYIILF
jgi:hypothetical protein